MTEIPFQTLYAVHFTARSSSMTATIATARAAHDRFRHSRRFRTPLPSEPAHRSLGAIVFEADGQSRDHWIAAPHAAHQFAWTDSRRTDRGACGQCDGPELWRQTGRLGIAAGDRQPGDRFHRYGASRTMAH